jgi:hypothetical protein
MADSAPPTHHFAFSSPAVALFQRTYSTLHTVRWECNHIYSNIFLTPRSFFRRTGDNRGRTGHQQEHRAPAATTGPKGTVPRRGRREEVEGRSVFLVVLRALRAKESLLQAVGGGLKGK